MKSDRRSFLKIAGLTGIGLIGSAHLEGSNYYSEKSRKSALNHIKKEAEKHDYGYSKRAVMYNFFAFHLKLNSGRVTWSPTVSEDFVTILPEGQLRVYTDDNPMPSDALMGDDAIMNYLNLK